MTSLDVTIAQAVEREAAWRHRRIAIRLAIFALCILVLWLAAARIKMSLVNVVLGVPGMADVFVRMFPPDLSYLNRLIAPTIETVQIAVWGTLLAVMASTPLWLLAAPHPTPPERSARPAHHPATTSVGRPQSRRVWSSRSNEGRASWLQSW